LSCFVEQQNVAGKAEPNTADRAKGDICCMCRTNFFTAMPAVSVDIVGMPLQSQLCAVTAIWNALTTHGAMHPTPDEIVTGLMAVNAGLETPMVADQLRGGFYTDHITGYLNQIGVQFAMLTPDNWIENLAALQGHPLLINTGNHWTVAADWTAAQITTVNPQNVMAFVDPDTLIYVHGGPNTDVAYILQCEQAAPEAGNQDPQAGNRPS
jgi:hypothetical protein